MKAVSPAKIYLTGEHAVVYGKPAIAIAVNRYAGTELIAGNNKQFIVENTVENVCFSLESQELNALYLQLMARYQAYDVGEISIEQLMLKPSDLVFFVIAHFSKVANIDYSHGFHFKIHSEIPLGCGMGSSAAIILTIVYVLNAYFQTQFSEEELFEIALTAEKLQHGRTTGFDLRICQSGGCLVYQDDCFRQKNIFDSSFFLVNTRKPVSTTGECVASVAKKYSASTIWNDFSDVATKVSHALAVGNFTELQHLLKINHRLLCDIGVVPIQVQQFIEKIEQIGGAAKICGAGSVTGDSGGIVLVLTHDEKSLKMLVNENAFDFFHVNIEKKGVTVYV